MMPKADTRTVAFLVDDLRRGGEPIRFSHLDEANTMAGVMARRGSTARVSVVSLDEDGQTFGPVMRLGTYGPVIIGTIN